ncbi:Ionotropic receptor 75 c [Frankliniella occidentalis]|nr:Ionotropic receptor 75 c [Frankliniella occidentalis]
MLLMLERGLRARQRRQWSARRPSCEREAGAVAAVGLDPIFPAHALLVLGALAALALLYAERRAAAQGVARAPRDGHKCGAKA